MRTYDFRETHTGKKLRLSGVQSPLTNHWSEAVDPYVGLLPLPARASADR